MTIVYKEYPDEELVEIRVNGKVTRADYDETIPRLEAFMAKHDRIKVLEVLEDFKGFESSVLYEGVKFDFKTMKHYSHCAVVSDHGWIGPLTRLLSPLFSVELRTFKRDEEQQARDWLESA